MNWHIIYTKSRYEKKIELTLLEKGFEVYCPKRRYKKKWSDRKKLVDEVLFKSYIFVRVSDSLKFDVLNTPGVVKFVNFKGEHATIRNADITKIKAMLNDFDHESIEILQMQPNEYIEIQSGVLMGTNGKILSIQGNKAYIYIDSIGMKIEVNLKSALINSNYSV